MRPILQISIRDQGIGIPPDELQEIFEPFVQSTHTQTKSGGTGLGLAICKEIIETHHGKIWAENNVDKGATFHFVIPQLRVEEAEILPAGSYILEDKSQLILMIDDEPMCHKSMALILGGQHYKLYHTYSGIEGLDYLHANVDNIDLILLDLMMPDSYGLHVLQEIKANPKFKHLKIIVQSASNDIIEFNQALEMGADNYIAKPYQRQEVVSIISEILQCLTA
jgi:two-component system sensor histidine kinase ChiS